MTDEYDNLSSVEGFVHLAQKMVWCHYYFLPSLLFSWLPNGKAVMCNKTGCLIKWMCNTPN